MSVHKSILKTSDFITYCVIGVALLLEWWLSTTLLVERWWGIVIGSMLLIISWMIIFGAKYQFKQHQQKSSPGHEITTLITNGLFSYSRNPIYVGMVLLPLAFAFLLDSWWLIGSVVPIFVLITYVLIIPEEHYLQKRFEEAYLSYSRKTRRWF